LDLANPFLVPLQLQRIMGRMGCSTGNQGPHFGSQSVTNGFVRLTDTRVIICEWAQFLTIFPSPQMAWTHTRVLQPAEYITAELRTPNPDFSQPQVAIVGYRNEVLS